MGSGAVPGPAPSLARAVEARVRGLGGVSTTAIGSVTWEGRLLPILACIVANEGLPERPWVLISAGVHGDEIAGVEAALDFLETQARAWAGWYQVAVLPCVNPGGLERGTLESAAGANLNRLFGTGSDEPEIVAVETWLAESKRRFLATFDLHEIAPDYCGEGFVEADNPRACYLYEAQADPSRRIGPALIGALPATVDVCRWPTIYNDRNDHGVVSYPEGCGNAIYAQRTTFDAYLHDRFTGHSFTLETPMGWPLAERARVHRIWLDAALECLRGSRL
jgi:hypothetical protein